MPVDFLGLFAILHAAHARYVLVGGLAMVLHGFDRMTSDVDLIVDLAPENARSVVAALVAAGYRSLAPVDPAQFADSEVREQWRMLKDMTVFSLWDSSHTRPNVDLFVVSPLPFDELYRNSEAVFLRGTPVRVASLQHLVQLKRLAGRDRDLADIRLIESRLAKDKDSK